MNDPRIAVLEAADVTAIGDALEQLAGLDEGEHTDWDELQRLAALLHGIAADRLLLVDDDRLQALAATLGVVSALIDDDANVPHRYESVLAGDLAEADSRTLARAQQIVRRLYFWARFPGQHPDRYTAGGASAEPTLEEERAALDKTLHELGGSRRADA